MNKKTKDKGYWTDSKLKAEAKKYTSIKDFRKNSPSAYAIFHKKNLVSKICSHMNIKKTKSWNEQNLRKIALKYNKRNDFAKNNPNAYSAATRKGLLDKICAHMQKRKSKHKHYWTKQLIKKESLKYNSRAEFRKNSGGAYNAAQKLNILDKVCSHMNKRHAKHKYYWTKSKIKKEAKKYKSRSEFAKKSSSASSAALRLGVLGKYCSHMNKTRKPSKYWSVERIKKEAKKYKSRNEFAKKSSSAYSAAQKLNILDKVCSHMKTRKSKKHGYWTYELICKEVKKYKTRTAFAIGSNGAYQKAYKLGILEDLCSKNFGVKKSKKSGYWCPSTLKLEAKKYKTRSEFHNKSSGAYNAATKLGILNTICSHMIKNPNKIWHLEKIRKEAKKYNSRGEFRKQSPGAYHAASKNKVLDQVCSHMKIAVNYQKRLLYAFEFPDNSVYVGLTYNYEVRYKNHMKRNKLIIKKTDKLGHTFVMFNELYDINIVGKKECELIENYRKSGWLILNKAKGGNLGTLVRKWTKESLSKEAVKYSTRKEFRDNNGGAERAAIRLNLMDYLYKITGWAKRIPLTNEEIFHEAKKYSRRNEFKKNAYRHYHTALYRKILNKACSHMKKKN